MQKHQQQQQQRHERRRMDTNHGNGDANGNGGNRPVHVVRFGTVKAAVWRNMVDMGNASRPMYNVTVSRSYKDGEEWKDSSSFGPEDLLPLAKALDEAHTFIYEQRAADAAGQ
jgi:hypothetical protein